MDAFYDKAEELLSKISRADINSSATLCVFRANVNLFRNVLGLLNSVLPPKRERMLDMGCGYGGLAKLIADSLGVQEVYGVDKDDHRLSKAKEKGLQVCKLDLERNSLPFPDDYFNLVTSFGVLEHLACFDNLVKEAYRVLKVQGLFLVSTPNLGSWINRMALLFGYQPRNLEVSRSKLVGVHRFYYKLYQKMVPVGHICSCTLRALKELLEHYNLKVLRCWGTGIVPSPDLKLKLVVKVFDALLSRRTTLSVRLFLLAQKNSANVKSKI